MVVFMASWYQETPVQVPLRRTSWALVIGFLISVTGGSTSTAMITRFVTTVGNSGSQINSVSFSPDGSRALSGDQNGNLTLWTVGGDESTWGLVKTVGNSGTSINSVSFSPDGSRVVSGDSYGYLKVWAVGGDESTWGLVKTVGNSGSNINSVEFSPDGSRVVTGDDDGNLKVWAVGGNESSWGLVKLVGNTMSNINSVNFSPDGSRVVSGDGRGNLKVWAVGGEKSTWGLITTVGSSGGEPIVSVRFSPDGSRVVSGDGTGSLNIWAVGGSESTWGLVQVVGNSGNTIDSVSFSLDGSRVVSGDYTGNLNLWAVGGDGSTWGLVKTVGNSGSNIMSVSFSLDGSRVVSGDGNGNLNLWAVGGDESDWVLMKTVGNSRAYITSASFSPDGSRVVSGDDSGTLNMWAVGGDESTWRLVKTVGTCESPIDFVSFSPDGSRVVSGDDDGNLKVWAVGGDASTWRLVKTVGTCRNGCSDARFSPDGSRLVCGDGWGNLTLWAVGGDESTWGLIKTVGNCKNGIFSANFSPDGSRVLSADLYGNLNLWAVGGDESSWGLVKTVGNSVSRISSVSFSPDWSKVVTGDYSGNLNLWAVGGDGSTWGLVKTVENSRNIECISISSDGSRMVSGDGGGNLNLWAVGGDKSTWGLIKMVGNSGNPVFPASFSPDGSRVVSGDGTGSLNIWAVGGDESSWGLVKTAENGRSVSFSPDGSRVVSGDFNRNLNLEAEGSSSNSSTWGVSPRVAFLIVVNHYPATFPEFTQMTMCGSELYSGGPYQVCNITLNQSSSTFLSRSSMPEVEDLLLRHLPGMRLNFTGADLSSIPAQDLPIPWRTLSLCLRSTSFPSSALDLFSFLNTSAPYVEELDISNTLVGGPIAFKLPTMRKLQATNTPITNVSADFFQPSMELLDLRNTSFLQAIDQGALNTDKLVFRHGVPSCSEPFQGYALNGVLCKICQHPLSYFDGRPSVQQCNLCLSGAGVAKLWVMGAVLLGLVLLLAPAAWAFRKSIKELRDEMKVLRRRIRFLEKKAKLTLFAYQQLAQLGYLANPLPPRTETLASAADVFNFHWLSNSALASCTLGLGYHAAWLMSLLEVALLIVVAVVVGRAFGVAKRESLTLAHSVTVMAVATKTLPLFDCDDRLVTSHLPLMLHIKKPYLKVDYRIDCSRPQHVVFECGGIFVLLVYCFVIPGLQALRLFRARHVINPPLMGQPTARLGPQHYVALARDEFGRLDEAELFPTLSLEQVRVAQVAAIRVREELLDLNDEFKKEVETVSDYVPCCWWWLPLPTLSRVLLAGIYVCPPQDQAFLGCVLCMCMALAVLHFRPHLRQTDNQHEMLCQTCVGFAFALTGVQPATPPWLAMAIGALMCLPALSLCCHILQRFHPAYKSRRQLEDLAVANVSQEEDIELPERAASPASEGKPTHETSASHPRT